MNLPGAGNTGASLPSERATSPVVSALDRGAAAIERVVRVLAVPFLRPSKVSSEPFLVGSRATAWLFALIYGVVEARDFLARTDSDGSPRFLEMSTWPKQWLLILAVGLVWAAFVYWAGGWWFQVRLYLSGVNPLDFARARRVYLAVWLVYALPGLAWAIVETLLYASPAAAREAGRAFAYFGLLVFVVWSTFSEYRAVLAGFLGSRSRIRIWFLALPLAWPFIFLGILALVFR